MVFFYLEIGGNVTEAQYQAKLTKKLKAKFPGCILLKNDPSYQQGILDWTLLVGEKWAALEVKASENSPIQPNQEYFVERLSEMSFAAFIYPENEAEVIRALEQALAP